MKKILTFILLLLPWFISSIIFKTDVNFYNNLNKPFFAPPSFIFPIIWTIIYILITISVYIIYSNNKLSNLKNYNIALILNYLSNQLFSYFFFTIKSPFLGFVDTVIVFITSLFLYYETKEINNNASKPLIIYLIWNLFAVVLSLSTYLLNL